MPRALEALYLKPLRREAEYGVPSCDLQLRSYSVRNLEFFCDFALRAAYYLGLPAYGPVPLPRMVQRWTVPKSTFIFKKSQENFERITLRRLIQIRDGHPETVQIWLAFLQKHAYYGIGMKANVWEFSKLGRSSCFRAQWDTPWLMRDSQRLERRWTRASSRQRSCWRTSGSTSATWSGGQSTRSPRRLASGCLRPKTWRSTWLRSGGGLQEAGKRHSGAVVELCISIFQSLSRVVRIPESCSVPNTAMRREICPGEEPTCV